MLKTATGFAFVLFFAVLSGSVVAIGVAGAVTLYRGRRK